MKDSSLATGGELIRNTEDAIPLNVDDGGSGEVVDIMTRGTWTWCVLCRERGVERTLPYGPGLCAAVNRPATRRGVTADCFGPSKSEVGVALSRV